MRREFWLQISDADLVTLFDSSIDFSYFRNFAVSLNVLIIVIDISFFLN